MGQHTPCLLLCWGLTRYLRAMDLRTALLGCSSGQLARIAAAWALDVEAGTLRRELVDVVAARIVAETQGSELWNVLGETERRALRVLMRAGGRHESDLLARRLGRTPAPGTTADETSRAVEAAVGG